LGSSNCFQFRNANSCDTKYTFVALFKQEMRRRLSNSVPSVMYFPLNYNSARRSQQPSKQQPLEVNYSLRISFIKQILMISKFSALFIGNNDDAKFLRKMTNICFAGDKCFQRSQMELVSIFMSHEKQSPAPSFCNYFPSKQNLLNAHFRILSCKSNHFYSRTWTDQNISDLIEENTSSLSPISLK